MKELKKPENVYLEKYDISVKPYLSYDEIQVILNAVEQFDMWSERQTNIDVLMLYFCTDIGKDKIEEIGHELLLSSGLIDDVRREVSNMNEVYAGLAYNDSISREMKLIMKDIKKIAGVGDKANGWSAK